MSVECIDQPVKAILSVIFPSQRHNSGAPSDRTNGRNSSWFRNGGNNGRGGSTS
jgi:hypothetical protein